MSYWRNQEETYPLQVLAHFARTSTTLVEIYMCVGSELDFLDKKARFAETANAWIPPARACPL
jgi:hypothetical protein